MIEFSKVYTYWSGSGMSIFAVIKKLLVEKMDRLIVKIYFSFFTIWILFADDLRLLAAPQSYDIVFDVITSIAFFSFAIEIILNCICKDGYFRIQNVHIFHSEKSFSERISLLRDVGSFSFWLDVLATVFIAFQIHWISSQNNYFMANYDGRNVMFALVIGRYCRLVQVIKIFMTSGYSTFRSEQARMQWRTHSTVSPSDVGEANPLDVNLEMKLETRLETSPMAIPPSVPDLPASRPYLKTFRSSGLSNSSFVRQDSLTERVSQSRVGAAMTDLTAGRVITLVMCLLLLLPLVTHWRVDNADIVSLKLMQRIYSIETSWNDTRYTNGKELLLDDMIEHRHLIRLVVDNREVYSHSSKLTTLRQIELVECYLPPSTITTRLSIRGIFDASATSQTKAFYRILETLFILLLIQIGTFFFNNDVYNLVIFPIEQMVSLVQRISKNPLAADYKMLGPKEGFKEGMETTMLLQTINKIGGLMRVCFGEAGASVIARNLVESRKNKLNLMGPGKLVNSIFGFCDIRRFTDTTECLQEEVMLFVNRIAYILHGIVVQCSGSANKNIGDAFLLTWKIDDKCDSHIVARLADQALLTFCKTVIEISRHHEFICNFSEEASNRLHKRFPGYKVQIGCGLHVGWAIEGAIGSHRKIDASYLSPHVNLSMYLEGSTKRYGVPLLMSEAFYNILSPSVCKYCRLVDRIRRRETETPFGLFTYDVDLSLDFSDTFCGIPMVGLTRGVSSNGGGRMRLNVLHDSNVRRLNQARTLLGIGTAGPAQERASIVSTSSKGHLPPPRRSIAFRPDPQNQRKLFLINESNSNLIDINTTNTLTPPPTVPEIKIASYEASIWDEDAELKLLRRQFTDKFRRVWEDAMQAFLDGNWYSAKDFFMQLQRDKVASYLLNVMESHGGVAPPDWDGFSEYPEDK